MVDHAPTAAPTAPRPGDQRGGPPWTLFVGLGVLWIGLASVTPMILMLSLWSTVGDQGLDPWVGLGVPIAALLLLATTLVLAGLGHRWARWVVIALAAFVALQVVLIAATAQVTPAILILLVAGAIGLAAVLLAAPVTGRWYREHPRRRRSRAAG
ncbi:hypothetical protein [Agrococcus beijingensis]|uniref:hypothetical protein n=1 Tax=Agrococcus beijingensis TaxID=3068634 RepID=UPI0027405C7A|nr:hypothetical protein [Agrococcus sp. REN33]